MSSKEYRITYRAGYYHVWLGGDYLTDFQSKHKAEEYIQERIKDEEKV